VTDCPSSEELDRFLKGQLSEARREAIRGHLRHCSLCEAELDRRTDNAGLHQWATAGKTPAQTAEVTPGSAASEPADILSADLHRFLAGEPIKARPAGPLERGWRWCLRNRRVAALASALVLVLIAGLAIVCWQWRRAEFNASAALANAAEAEQKRKESDENFRAMIEAVDKYLVHISENRLLNEPGMQPLRKDLLTTARDFYQRFAEKQKDSFAFRAERALALQRLGNITLILDGPAKSFPFYKEALAIQKDLVAEDPKTAGHRLDLASTWNNLGTAREAAGDRVKAEAAYRKVLELSEQESDSAIRLMAVRGHINLGKVLKEGNSLDTAIKEYEKALAISQALVKERRELPDSQRGLAYSYNNLGDLYRALGQLDRAEESLRQSIATWEALLKDFPEDLSARHESYRSTYNLCWALVLSGRIAEAGTLSARGMPRLKGLTAENPNISAFRSLLREWQNLQGLVFQCQGQYAPAKSAFEEAIRAIDRDMQISGPSSHLAQESAFYRMDLANLLREQNQIEAALPHYDQAIAVLGPYEKQKPPDFAARYWLRAVHNARAVALTELGRHAAAAADWERARALDPGDVPHLWAALLDIAHARAAGKAPSPLPAGHYAAVVAELDRYMRAALPFGSELYTLAQLCALASRTAAGDEREAAADRAKRSTEYAAHAMALLKRAKADGYFRIAARRERLKSDPGLESLRGRDDFKELAK
jgi:tetratricopeptide (TPR) repeat protein